MIVSICIGSSCYLKGSQEIVDQFTNAIAQYHLEQDITLTGSFCSGRCNREGVTIQVDDTVYTGVTPASCKDFFEEHIHKVIQNEKLGDR